MFTAFDIAVVVGTGFVVLGFVVGRKLLFLVLISLGITTIFVVGLMDIGDADISSLLLALLGVAGFSLGLAGVRIMAYRSVSLDILENIENEGSSTPGRNLFECRLVDLRKYGVVSVEAGECRLTGFGRFISGCYFLALKILGWQM